MLAEYCDYSNEVFGLFGSFTLLGGLCLCYLFILMFRNWLLSEQRWSGVVFIFHLIQYNEGFQSAKIGPSLRPEICYYSQLEI